jgi:hypothetical protein
VDDAGLTDAEAIHQLDVGRTALILGQELTDLVLAQSSRDVSDLRLRRLGLGRRVAGCPLKDVLELVEVLLEAARFRVASYNVNR